MLHGPFECGMQIAYCGINDKDDGAESNTFKSNCCQSFPTLLIDEAENDDEAIRRSMRNHEFQTKIRYHKKKRRGAQKAYPIAAFRKGNGRDANEYGKVSLH